MIIGFDDRNVIVTGAAHGFGRVIAQGFAERGATVHICDINDIELNETRSILGEGCQAHVVDVGDRRAVHATIAAIEAKSGAIDILVNKCRGSAGPGGAAA
jgi:3-oxoacyl-[acyl-carrier protein] reductase